MRTLIKDGTVVTASDTFKADVWIEGSKSVGLTDPALRAAQGQPDTVVDAAGKLVGFFTDPNDLDAWYENLERQRRISGADAAAAGGMAHILGLADGEGVLV